MASCQPFAQSLKPQTATTSEPKKHSSNGFNGEAATQETESNEFIGYLEVFIHHAREIQNICIYHKQDVYAKLCLTSDPEATVSTRTVNGGGRNPVFNEKVRLNVRTLDCSLKCEVFMLSRIKNYLEDQLLGFALVPISDVATAANGKLAQEFSLSATDLHHSPSGFVELSLSYTGSSPEITVVSAPLEKVSVESVTHNDPLPSDYKNIEFPDLNLVTETQQMVSDYFGITCTDIDSQKSPDVGEGVDNEAGVQVVESFAEDTPASNVSTDGSSSDRSRDDKGRDVGESGVDSLIKLNLEPEQTVKQEDIVDMYMKSMQQFTESLAKMKLPMDLENNCIDTENTGQKVQAAKRNSSRVFYGSRAFF